MIDPAACSGYVPSADACETQGRDHPSDACETQGREAETATGLLPGASARGEGLSDPEPPRLDAASITTRRDFERLLRSIGFSRSAAAKLAGGGWSALRPDEPAASAAPAEVAEALFALAAKLKGA